MTPQPLPSSPRKSSTLLIVLIVGGALLACCPVVGILAAIAIPNFIKFQARAKQSECKVAVKAAWVAEKAYFAEHDAYTEDPKELMYTHDGKRSLVVFGASTVGSPPGQSDLEGAIHAHVPGVGVSGQCPQCSFTVACALNADNDPQIDVWSVSSRERKSESGAVIAAGQPFNDFNDVTDEPGR